MQAFVIGVAFKPGGAFPFLRMPAGELRDTTVSLDTLWGGAATDLRDRLLEAPTHQDRFQFWSAPCWANSPEASITHRAVDFALRRFMEDPHVATVAGVTDQIGLSSQTIHPSLPRSNWIHAQSILPHSPIPAGA